MVELADESSEDVLDTRLEVSGCGLMQVWLLSIRLTSRPSADFADAATPSDTEQKRPH